MVASFLTYKIFRDSVGNTRETACFTWNPIFLLNWRNVQDSLYILSAITINLIVDAPARDNVSGNNIVYRYSTSKAISEDYETNRVVLILPLTQKPQVALPLTRKPLLNKTYVLGKSTNSLFSNHHKQPESVIKGPTGAVSYLRLFEGTCKC